MKTVKGIYAEAKIFTDDVEDYALAQVKMICDNEIAEGSTICLIKARGCKEPVYSVGV